MTLLVFAMSMALMMMLAALVSLHRQTVSSSQKAERDNYSSDFRRWSDR